MLSDSPFDIPSTNPPKMDDRAKALDDAARVICHGCAADSILCSYSPLPGFYHVPGHLMSQFECKASHIRAIPGAVSRVHHGHAVVTIIAPWDVKRYPLR
jgi:hypothetical protein